MRRIAQALVGLVVLAVPAAAQAVGTTPIIGPTTAAVTSDGEAAAAIGAAESRIVLVSRGRGDWREQDVSGTVDFSRDAQVAVNRHGTVVAAWSQYTRARGNELVVAAGRAGGVVRVIARRGVARASSAYPRLAVLTSERVLLAWRDGTTVRVAPVLGARLGRSHVVARRAGTIAFAAMRSTAVLAWVNRYAGSPTRALRSAVVQSAGAPVGRPLLVSRAVPVAVRIAASSEPRAMVSWLRPGTPLKAYTRQIAPFARPARPVVTGATPTDVPAIDLAPDGSAALAQRVTVPGLIAFGIVSAHSQSGGVWTRFAPLAAGRPMVGRPHAVALGDRRSLTVWADAATPRPGYDIRVAVRDAAGGVTRSQVLPTPYLRGDGNGVGVADAGRRVLVAYGAPGGGFAVAELSG